MAWQVQKYKGDIASLKTIIGNGQDAFGQIGLDDLEFSTFNLVRSFSFVGAPVYWSDDEDNTPGKGVSSQSKRAVKSNGKQS